MHRLATLAALPLLFTAAYSIVDATPAAASPEQRPVVRDHRPEPVVVVRHRRRPGPRFMMPLRIDIGAQGVNTEHGFLPGIEMKAGIHWASLSPEPTNFDLGLGVFGAAFSAPKSESQPDADRDLLYGGAYLEIGQTLSHGDWWRTWASGRGEYLASSAFGEDHTGFGAAGRLSAELYVSGVGIEPRGVFLGTYAIGAYAEVGARDLGDDVGLFQVSGGLTFRTPLVLAP
jgi:hypothetical protein